MKEYLLVNAADASADVTSVPIDLGDMHNYGITVLFSDASLGGTLTLQAGPDYTNWITIPNSSQTVTAGANHVWNVSNAGGYRYVRAFWDAGAGTGTLTMKAIVKES